MVVVVRLAVPHGRFVELNALVRSTAEHHRAEAAVADGQRFDPFVRGAIVPQRNWRARRCLRGGVRCGERCRQCDRKYAHRCHPADFVIPSPTSLTLLRAGSARDLLLSPPCITPPCRKNRSGNGSERKEKNGKATEGRKRIFFFGNRLTQRNRIKSRSCRRNSVSVAPFTPVARSCSNDSHRSTFLAGLHHRYRYNRTRWTVNSPAPSATCRP